MYHISAMIQTVCVLALVALSFVEGQGNTESRPAQPGASLGGGGGAGGLVVPMATPTGQPITANQPALLPQTQPYSIFDLLFNDFNYNNNWDNGASNTNTMTTNNNYNNNAMNNDLMLAMMMGFDFGL
ncbi:conserved oligomeric Golgi complex subunit 8-like [Pecten maximus]|uniref:conserved oligomeric Golgi complex subunit 8-like n=1 Tax=Pecten maximus TaxID=6579 RepID=UPI0014581571|nr:conserved oligomeric Golgi complex subunit 8-like [Pecten maximus]